LPEKKKRVQWLRFGMVFKKHRRTNDLYQVGYTSYAFRTDRLPGYKVTDRGTLTPELVQDVDMKVYETAAKNLLSKFIDAYPKITPEDLRTYVYDKLDPYFDLDNLGKEKVTQYFYVNVRQDGLFIEAPEKQLSKLRYIPSTETWAGLEKDDDGRYKEIHVAEYWVNKTLTKEQKQRYIDIAMREHKRFLALPIGDNKNYSVTPCSSVYPETKYRNNEKSICVYASFASALHYRGHTSLAERIIVFSQSIEKVELLREESFLCMNEFIEDSKIAKPFRRRYKRKKFNLDPSVIDPQPSNELDIWVVVLEASDGQMTHAVALTGDLIFDSNLSHTLPRTAEGINACCGDNASFLRIKAGYIWMANDKAKIPY
jgi:hypothetical protein